MRPRPPPFPPSPSLVVVAAASALEELPRDFLERQEAVALGAVVDEAGFEAGLDAGDDGLVDVALALFLARGFDVEVDEPLAVDDGHAEFFRLRGIEKHALHVFFPARNRPDLRRGEAEAARGARRDAIGRRTRAEATVAGSGGCGRTREEWTRVAFRMAAAPMWAGQCVLVGSVDFAITFKR